MSTLGARLETAQTQLDLAKSQLAHATTLFNGAQALFNQLMAEMGQKGPAGTQLVKLDDQRHVLLFEPPSS